MKAKSIFLFVISAVISLGSALSFSKLGKVEGIAPIKKEIISEPTPGTEISQDDLSSYVVESTTTDICQTYEFAFATEITTYTTREKNVYVTITDPSFDPNGQYAPQSEEEYQTFEAKVYRVYGNTSSTDVVIPTKIKNTGEFYIKVTGILADVVQPVDVGLGKWDNITSIVIPSGIEEIAPSAFIEVPNEVSIKCEPESISKTAWPSDFTDATDVQWNHQLTSTENTKATKRAVSAVVPFGSQENFFLGYYGENEYNLPLMLGVDKVNPINSTFIERVYFPFTKKSKTGLYDGIGNELSRTTFSTEIFLDLDSSFSYDDSSVCLYNIYKCKEGTKLPDLEKGPFHSIPGSSSRGKTDINLIASISTLSIETFSHYIQVDVLMDTHDEAYKVLYPSSYELRKKDIESGYYHIRHLLSALVNARYIIKYEFGNEIVTKTLKVNTPVENYNISRDGKKVGFIINYDDVGYGFSISTMKSIQIQNLTFHLDISQHDKDKKIPKSEVEVTFGNFNLITKELSATTIYNLNDVVLFSSLIFFGTFIILAIAYYFYKKIKYKNDEFLRMNTKKYVIKALTNLLGCALTFYAILFIVLRWGFMNTSIVAYNPLDVFVIIFSILALIYIGLKIKDLVVYLKVRKQKRLTEKLKLDQDKVDDGTL